MPQKWLSIKNFEKYQHYKKRCPPWIKLYRSILTDREFMKLSTSAKYTYIGLLLLASETGQCVPNDTSWISHRLAMNPSEIDLKSLYRSGLLIASESTIYRATKEKSALREETETEIEIETEKTPLPPKGELVVLDDFEIFWKSYPRKIGKGAARKAWEKAKDRPPLHDILTVLDLAKQSAQWKKEQGQFIPHASTWLSQGRWADEVQVPTGPYDPNGFLSGLQSLIERHQA